MPLCEARRSFSSDALCADLPQPAVRGGGAQSAEACAACISGTREAHAPWGVVRISVTVASDGSVTEVKTISGNKMLSLAAEEAVKKWKFVAGDSQSTLNIDVHFDPDN